MQTGIIHVHIMLLYCVCQYSTIFGHKYQHFYIFYCQGDGESFNDQLCLILSLKPRHMNKQCCSVASVRGVEITMLNQMIEIFLK